MRTTNPPCPSSEEVGSYHRAGTVGSQHPYSGRCGCLLCADTRRGYGWPARRTHIETLAELRQRRRQGVVEVRRPRHAAVS
jgi:hypothetical protein